MAVLMHAPFPVRSASAPPTISMISVVIESCRARFTIARERAGQLVGVLRRRRHRPLLAGVEGRGALEQRGEQLGLERCWRELGRAAPRRPARTPCSPSAAVGSGVARRLVGLWQRQELTRLDGLARRGAEPHRHEQDLVDRAEREPRAGDLGDVARVGEGRSVREALQAVGDLDAAEPEVGRRLLADRDDGDGHARGAKPRRPPARRRAAPTSCRRPRAHGPRRWRPPGRCATCSGVAEQLGGCVGVAGRGLDG